MAEKELLDPVDATGTISRYEKVKTSCVERGRGKEVWKTERIHYDPVGYTSDELDELGYEDFEKLSEENPVPRDRLPKSGQSNLPLTRTGDLTAGELWQIIRPERAVAIRAEAFAELMRRHEECAQLASFVDQQLAANDLKPTWRNTLVFATEHLEFLDAGQRQRLRDRLRTLVTDLNAEWHPRSRLAQEAALRRYSSLIDDKAQLGEIVRFLGTGYPLRIRLITLQAIQNAFAAAPPSASVQRDLEPLRDELRRMVDFFFRPETLARSEEDFDLGLSALEALIRLADPVIPEFVQRVSGIGRSWVARQLAQFLDETRAAWAKPDSVSASEPARALCEALELLQTIDTRSGR